MLTLISRPQPDDLPKLTVLALVIRFAQQCVDHKVACGPYKHTRLYHWRWARELVPGGWPLVAGSTSTALLTGSTSTALLTGSTVLPVDHGQQS